MRYREWAGLLYEEFWELPAALVMMALWLAGAMLIGSFALVLHLLVSVLG